MRAEQLHLNAALEDRHWWFVGRRSIVRRLVHRILPRGATIVDVGCGTGGNLGALAAEYACVGVDTSPDAIALARERFPGIRFLEGRAPEDLGALAAEARLFLLADVIEHVEDDAGFLARLVRSASPGALFLITVPADPGLWSRHDETHLHFRRYERADLARLWERLPVTCLLLSHFNARLHPIVRAVRGWSRRRGKASGAAGTDLFLPARPVNWALTKLFAGEGRTLEGALASGGPGYAAGVSLIAILKREPGAGS